MHERPRRGSLRHGIAGSPSRSYLSEKRLMTAVVAQPNIHRGSVGRSFDRTGICLV